jgi:ribosome maturation factor RimP
LAKEGLIQELTDLFAPYFAEQNLELVDLILRPQGSRLMVTVLAHREPAGITLEECAKVCRSLRDLLEEKQIIPGDYALEVASPGLDRPLKVKKDFLRNLNQEAVFFLNDLVDGKCQWQGLIIKAEDATVLVQVEKGALEIPLTKINKAQLVI